MIDQITGKILLLNDSYLVIELGGFGIRVNVPKLSSKNFKMNEILSLSTYLHVREDALDLYGFESESDRGLFLMLISISGIGPKLGLTIISGLAPEKLKMKIISGDVKALTTIPGVGLKTAKRIIIELKEKFIDFDDDDLGIKEKFKGDLGMIDNVVNALVNLGYSKTEATKVCNKLIDKGEFNGNLELLIKRSLSKLIS